MLQKCAKDKQLGLWVMLEIHGNLEIHVTCITDRGVKRVWICALDLVFGSLETMEAHFGQIAD